MNLKKIPIRRCIGCGEMIDKKGLIRVVKTTSGEILLDDSGKKNGRGAYICKNKECIEKAAKTKALDKSFKIKVPQEIYDRLSEEMAAYEEHK